MKIKFFKKAFGLIVALLMCGAWGAVKAQSNNIQINSGAGHVCMDAGSTINLTATLPAGTTQSSFQSITWRAAGGVTITYNGLSATVTSMQGTTFADSFSKYGKGRVWITAVVDLNQNIPAECEDLVNICNPVFSASIDIYKSFSNAHIDNWIVGPTCVRPGEEVTYSVAPWVSLLEPNRVGFDIYDWHIPAGALGSNMYYSADRSSVTFVVGNNPEGQVITVGIGRCNISETRLTLALAQTPADPIFSFNGTVITNDTLCLPLGNYSNTNPVTIRIDNPQQGVTYTWENLGGWTVLNNSQNSHILTVVPAGDARTLRVKMDSDCETSFHELVISRSLNSNINSIINSENSNCLVQGANVQFSVSGAADGMQMSWTINTEGIANGWQINDPTIAVPTITVGTGPAVISVAAGCGNAISMALQVRPNIPVIEYSTRCLTFEQSQTITLSVPQDGNATEFHWIFPATWQPLNPADRITTATTITITTDGETVGEVKVMAIGAEGCEAVVSDAVEFEFLPVAPEIKMVSTCINVGLEGTAYFRVSNHIDGQEYTWTIDPAFGTQDMFFTPPANDPSLIRVITTGNEGTFTITVTASNDCDSNGLASEIYTVDVENIFWATNETIGTGLGMTRVLSIDGDLAYDVDIDNIYIAWYVNGVFHSSDFALFSISFLNRNIPNGHAEAIITYDNCKYRVETSWGNLPQFARQISLESYDEEVRVANNITIFPNPANDIVRVILPEVSNGSVFLLSLDGRVLKRKPANSLEIEFNVSNIPNGIYVISAAQNGKRYSKQLIISR